MIYRGDYMRILKHLSIVIVAAWLAATASAQTFPVRPVQAVLPYSVGTGADVVMRSLAVHLAGAWGHPVVINNKPGANGWLAIGEVRRAVPDGHTLMMVDSTHMTLQPNLYRNLPFDPVADFEPVATAYTTNVYLFVRASSPWNSVGDMLADPRAKSGQLNYGSWGMGSTGHFAAELLAHSSGVRMTHVPFKELPMVYTAVASGDIDMAFGSIATVAPLVKAGKLKMIGYAGGERSSAAPDVPTIAQSGGPAGFALPPAWIALFAPKGLPRPVVEAIRAEMAKALRQPSVKETLVMGGFEPWTGPLDQVRERMAFDTRRYAEAVKTFRISVD